MATLLKKNGTCAEMSKPLGVGHCLSVKSPIMLGKGSGPKKLKSIRVHFAPAEIAITLELLSQFLRFLDQNDRRSHGVLLIYSS